MDDRGDVFEGAEEIAQVTDDDDNDDEDADNAADDWRYAVAQAMWDQYQAYLAGRHA